MDTLQPGKAVNELPIDLLLLKKAAFLLRAINHRLRQQVLRHLHRQGETCVTDLYQTLHLDQSVASQHLSILRQAGVVITRRKGKHILYSVNDARLDALMKFAARLGN